MKERSLVPLNRQPDSDPARSEEREQLAVALEKLADRVRADDEDRRFFAWDVDHLFTTVETGTPRSPLETANTEVTTIRVTWRRS